MSGQSQWSAKPFNRKMFVGSNPSIPSYYKNMDKEVIQFIRFLKENDLYVKYKIEVKNYIGCTPKNNFNIFKCIKETLEYCNKRINSNYFNIAIKGFSTFNSIYGRCFWLDQGNKWKEYKKQHDC